MKESNNRTTEAVKVDGRRSVRMNALQLLAISFMALAPLFILSCSSSPFIDLPSLKSEMALKEFPEAGEYPDADAVVISDVHDVQLFLDNDGDFETEVHVTKLIKLFRNVDENASVQIPVYSGDRIYDLAARTIEPDGSTVPLSKTDFHVITGGGSDYVFYSDEKKVRFTFPALQVGSMIEYHYTILESHPFIEDVWEVQGIYPEMSNVYKLTIPSRLLVSPQNGGYGWNWRYKAYNCDPGEPVFHKNPNEDNNYMTVTLTWQMKDVPAFKPDPAMPPYEDYLQYVKFSPSDWKTWDDISEWYYKYLFKPQLDITPAISSKAKELTEGCETETSRIDRLFKFTQSLRYAAIELGQGGYVPNKPETVLKRMYGDCKDKSILLVALLRSQGIEAKPVLVLTSDEGKVDPLFPSWTFNHMIVQTTARDGQVYWLDPTADQCGLGQLPYQDEATNVLVLNDDNTASIETLPASTFNRNARNIFAKVEVKNDGEAKFKLSLLFKGEENLRERETISDLSREEMMRYAKSLLAEHYLKARIDSCYFENLDDSNKPLTMNIVMSIPDALKNQEGVSLLDIDPIRIVGDWAWLAREHRKYPIEFDYPKMTTKTIEVSLPQEYKIAALPKAITLKSDGLYYTRNFISDGSHGFEINESFAVTSRDIKPEDYDSVKTFVEGVDAASEQMILLQK